MAHDFRDRPFRFAEIQMPHRIFDDVDRVTPADEPASSHADAKLGHDAVEHHVKMTANLLEKRIQVGIGEHIELLLLYNDLPAGRDIRKRNFSVGKNTVRVKQRIRLLCLPGRSGHAVRGVLRQLRIIRPMRIGARYQQNIVAAGPGIQSTYAIQYLFRARNVKLSCWIHEVELSVNIPKQQAGAIPHIYPLDARRSPAASSVGTGAGACLSIVRARISPIKA